MTNQLRRHANFESRIDNYDRCPALPARVSVCKLFTHTHTHLDEGELLLVLAELFPEGGRDLV